MLTRYSYVAIAPVVGTGPVQSATQNSITIAPTIGASGVVDYQEFGPSGDLSIFGASVFTSSRTNLDVATAEIDFSICLGLTAPERGASGGLSVFDDQGLYLAGDLIELGTRGFLIDNGMAEFQFGRLKGRGASEWPRTLLMNVVFFGTGPDPFASLSDGETCKVAIGMFAVQGGGPIPYPIPLPMNCGSGSED